MKLKNSKILKSHNGITLTNLVITIIVILILAVAGFNITTGKNSVINEAANILDSGNIRDAQNDLDILVREVADSYYNKKYSESNDERI